MVHLPLTGAASIGPLVEAAADRGESLPGLVVAGLLVTGGGGVVGVLLRRLIRSGGHRTPEDQAPGRGLPGTAVRDPRWLPPGLALGWLGVVGALSELPVGVVCAYLAALTVGAWLMAVDADVQRLPNAVTLPAIPVSAAALGGCSALARDPPAAGRALLGGLLLGVGYLLLYAVGAWRGAPGIGLGDVKLAFSLGQWLAWLGWPVLLTGAYLGLVLSGLCALGLLVGGRAGPRTALPHGPAMVAGAWLGSCAAPLL